MAGKSIQKKLTRVRPSRVQTSYQLRVGDAIERQELPFASDVMADSNGQPAGSLPRLGERRFVDVNPENFNSLLESMKPYLSDHKLSEDPKVGELRGNAGFRSVEDSEPD